MSTCKAYPLESSLGKRQPPPSRSSLPTRKTGLDGAAAGELCRLSRPFRRPSLNGLMGLTLLLCLAFFCPTNSQAEEAKSAQKHGATGGQPPLTLRPDAPCSYTQPLTELPPKAQTPAVQPTNTLRLDDLEGLKLADSLLAAGRVAEAGQIYALLLDSPSQEVRIEAIFQTGNIHMLMNEPGKAVACYMSILNAYPGLVRVRLELARAYFADEDYEKADFHFRLVLGDNEIPGEVAEKINLFLAAIRRHKNWSLSGNVGLAPDSNLNQASGEERECIRTVFGLLCRELPEKESGLGFKAALNGTHYLRLSKNFGIKSDAGISVLDFKESAYDDNRFTVASGPRVIFPGGEASLQPTFATRWVGGTDYSKSWGARLALSFDPTERLGIDAGLSFEYNRYDDPFVNSLLKGHTTDAWLDVRYVLSNKSMVTAGASLTRDSTEAASFASDGWGCSLGYYREFPLAFTAYAELSYNRVVYREGTWFIRQDGFIEEKTRKDRIYQAYLRLANRHWEASGFTPSISYIYTKRDSNAWNYEYNKHRFEFGIKQSF